MTARIWECDNKTYHADNTKVGSSMLKVAIRSPAEYRRRYIDVPPLPAETTPAMTLGSALHCLVLEPENFDSLFCCRPAGIDGRTKEGKEALAKFRLSAIGKEELTIEQHEQAKAMANAVLAESQVADMLAEAVFERAILWEDGEMICKCKTDIFIPRPELDSDLILDLKTSDDPTPETWSRGGSFAPIPKYRYDLQGAHYRAGVSALTGRPASFGLVVVGKDEPHDVYLYDLAEWMEIGDHYRAIAMRAIATGAITGWRRPEQGTVIKLFPSAWDLSKE